MTSLKDNTAVITGASSGIGRQIAISLAAAGMRLALLGRNEEALEKVAARARETSPQVGCYPVDLTSESAIRQVEDALRRGFAHIDVLIHSAGIIVLGALASASAADFDRQYQVNVRAPFLLTQTLLPMLRPRRGQIVFINSSAGLNAAATNGQYAATKFALKAIADSFRHALNADGIRVLSIYPGRTASPMQAAIYKSEGRRYHPERLMQPDDVAEIVVNALSLPCSAEITDIHVRPLIKSR